MDAELTALAEKLQIGQYHRHVFLCIGDACCSAEAGAGSWEALKTELKTQHLSLSTGPTACYRTKVQCLRVCKGGPIAVVYPDGTYYAGLTAERVPRFVREHLIENHPIEEWIFARNPLPNGL